MPPASSKCNLWMAPNAAPTIVLLFQFDDLNREIWPIVSRVDSKECESSERLDCMRTTG